MKTIIQRKSKLNEINNTSGECFVEKYNNTLEDNKHRIQIILLIFHVRFGAY